MYWRAAAAASGGGASSGPGRGAPRTLCRSTPTPTPGAPRSAPRSTCRRAPPAAPPGDAALPRPFLYLVEAPPTNVLDALPFLSLARAQALVATWVAALVLWGLLRAGSWRLRIGRAALGFGTMVFLVAATLVLPRPVPRPVTADSSAAGLCSPAPPAPPHD